MWASPTPAAALEFKQVWFAGAHSDVGGGYAEGALADVSLRWMAREAQACGLAFRPEAFAVVDPDDPPADLEAGWAEGRYAHADPGGPLHDSRQSFYRFLPAGPRAFGAGDPSQLIADSVRARAGRDPDYAAALPASFAEALRAGRVEAVGDTLVE